MAKGITREDIAKNLAKKLEYSLFLLRPEATEKMIGQACKEAKKYGFYGVNVNPANLKVAVSALKNSGVKVVAAVGYPLGANTTETKIFEARQSVALGADEIEVVMNIEAFKSKKYALVRKELAAIKRAAKKPLSVIIEAPLLTDKEVAAACKIAKTAGAAAVKSSAGLQRCATPRDVKLMRRAVGKDFVVKAAGKIRTKGHFLSLINAGADRIVTSSAVQIMKE